MAVILFGGSSIAVAFVFAYSGEIADRITRDSWIATGSLVACVALLLVLVYGLERRGVGLSVSVASLVVAAPCVTRWATRFAALSPRGRSGKYVLRVAGQGSG